MSPSLNNNRSFRWAPLRTLDSVPESSSPKGETIHRPSPGQWLARKEQIQQLWKKHELVEVKRILENDGFIASESQIRHHLWSWGATKKYLKLSDKQIKYIIRKLLERGAEKKTTAFKYKVSDERLPSAKIQRTLARKKGGHGVYSEPESPAISSFSGLSTPGIHGYTPGLFTPGLLMEYLYNREETFLAHKVILIKLREGIETGFRELQESHPDSNLTLYDIRTSLPAGSARDAFQILCMDCPPRLSPDSHPRDGESFEKFLVRYERDHLRSQNHLGRVSLRLLGDPEPWCGRTHFVKDYGMTCPHNEPGFFVIEKAACWETGGCRWSQFKTVEEGILENHKEVFLEEDVVGLAWLSEPVAVSLNEEGDLDMGDFVDVTVPDWNTVDGGDFEGVDNDS